MDVSPNRDGRCPACGGDAKRTHPDRRDLVKAEFVDGEKLPNLCCVCGKTSSGHVESGVLNEVQSLDTAGLLARVLGAIASVTILYLRPESERKKFALSVQLPVCAVHQGIAAIEPLFVDQRAYRLTFPVHKALLQAWEKQRGRS